ncbi:surface lipoprotein assembly modifier [Alloalcanivorax marinus]|uniref:surface lipoprotein assembly modifier n=1 Tax=Alloalcanivorax marinus TaxID=1177169 RepID=UPI001932C03D|nr:surface lipoprotein assembly modifier [Alloalcanivorax marinus]MBL7251872.1 DUF560 domain-containing protein [Alloalcanivorax marinus]
MAFGISQNVVIADQDTELRLQQDIERSARQREQELLRDERAKDEALPNLIINGEEYQVRRNRNDLGRALYVALRSRNWSAAVRFLDAYRELENPDPILLHYAEGKLARLRGDLDRAEQEFRSLLALNDTFLPGRLELARVLFENQKNREAETRFRDILAQVEGVPDQRKTAGVRSTLENFLQALKERRSWQGRIAVGPGYSDNVNQSSESETCLIWFAEGLCYVSRTAPEAISTETLTYEMSLEKDVFLPGHHGLYFRGLAYGDRYRDYSIYNQDTINASAGYRFRDVNDVYSLAPSFEHARYGNDGLYDAWGARAEWMHYLSPRTAFKFEASHKRMRYREVYSRFDGDMNNLYATAWHRLNGGWTLFGGLDGVDRNTEEALSSYEQYGLRLGVSRSFPLVESTMFASLREKHYDAYSALLGERREDRERRYIAMFSFPRLSVAGLVPSLNLEHTRVRSNVDWLYSYEENAASLKFEWRF